MSASLSPKTTTNMKTTIHIARVLLGLLFLVFGLNGFLHFIPSPQPSGLAGQFLGAMFVSHYLSVVFALQVLAGALLLSNRFVPAALTILGALLVNIALFHACLSPVGYAPAVIAIALWTIVLTGQRKAFVPLLAARSAA
jgi:hypothetical protein